MNSTVKVDVLNADTPAHDLDIDTGSATATRAVVPVAHPTLPSSRLAYPSSSRAPQGRKV